MRDLCLSLCPIEDESALLKIPLTPQLPSFGLHFRCEGYNRGHKILGAPEAYGELRFPGLIRSLEASAMLRFDGP